MKRLVAEYERRRAEIEKRMEEFRKVWGQPDERIFAELAFCICTPQSRAEVCWAAIEKLTGNNTLYRGSARKIEKYLRGVRFHKKKAQYIELARDFFTEKSKLKIKHRIGAKNAFEVREFLAGNVKGIGYKEASHFLRNIGLGSGLAILDRHILKNLERFGVIGGVPKSLAPRKYMEIESRMYGFSEKIGIPLGHLDLLFWSMETGKVFK